MLPSFASATVKIQRAALVETRGSTIRDWDNYTEHCLSGCEVQETSTASNELGRAEQVTDRWELYAPPCADIQTGDRVIFHGEAYEVDGAPFKWKSPTGRVSHTRAHLVRWSG